MDQDLLVERGIEHGQKLIRQLIRAQFEVEAAFWVKVNDDGLWRLYIASAAVNPEKLGGAFRVVYAVLAEIPGCSITPAEITLINNRDPIAQDAAALRDIDSKGELLCYRQKRIGNLFAAELRIYPRRLPLRMRQLPDGPWQVLISEPDDVWLTCDSEAEARSIAAAPVLEYEALAQLKSGEPFASELEKTADALAKYRMSFGSRFLKRRVQEARNE